MQRVRNAVLADTGIVLRSLVGVWRKGAAATTAATAGGSERVGVGAGGVTADEVQNKYTIQDQVGGWLLYNICVCVCERAPLLTLLLVADHWHHRPAGGALWRRLRGAARRPVVVVADGDHRAQVGERFGPRLRDAALTPLRQCAERRGAELQRRVHRDAQSAVGAQRRL